MTKRPEVIDYVLQSGISFLEQELSCPAIGKDAACNGMQDTFDQTIDFDYADENATCCASTTKHSLHVAEVVSAAKLICASCPLSQACATWASTNGELGVWGGTTKSERETVIKTFELSAERAAQLSEEYVYLTTAPVRKICTRYNAVPRTVARWRSQLRVSQARTN